MYIYFLLLVYNQRIYRYHSRCYSIVHSLSKGVALQRPKNTVSSASDLLQLLSSENIYKKEEASKEVSVNNNSNLYYTLHYKLQYLTISVLVEVHLHLQYIIHCNTYIFQIKTKWESYYLLQLYFDVKLALHA